MVLPVVRASPGSLAQNYIWVICPATMAVFCGRIPFADNDIVFSSFLKFVLEEAAKYAKPVIVGNLANLQSTAADGYSH